MGKLDLYNKIIVIGCPGSGKSTFSIKLHKKLKIPLYHLDLLNWNSNKTVVEKSMFIEKLSNVIKKRRWIIDGNYGSSMEMRLKKCDTVIFLDYSLEVCIQGVKDRIGKKREDMPWIETEIDEDFMNFILGFNENVKPKILYLLDKYSNKNIYVFKTRYEADEFLEKLNNDEDDKV